MCTRKRSQVAVVAEDGRVQFNRNVVNGSEPMLRLIGDLPAGTPVAFESDFGWGPPPHPAAQPDPRGGRRPWYDRTGSYWTGPGRSWLADLDLPPVSREIITDCVAFTGALGPEISRIDAELRQHAKADPRVKVLTALPGAGQLTALVMLAEIGDITRFPSARKLASWAGLTPTVRGSDLTVRHGHISKQGSAQQRWVPARPRRPRNGPRSSPRPTPRSPGGAGRRSPPSRSPASC